MSFQFDASAAWKGKESFVYLSKKSREREKEGKKERKKERKKEGERESEIVWRWRGESFG